METDFFGFYFQFCCVLVSDGEPECTIGFEDSVDLADPLKTPLKVVFFLLLVIVNIVLVTDVKGWVGKDQVDCAGWKRLEQLDAIALMKLVFG